MSNVKIKQTAKRTKPIELKDGIADSATESSVTSRQDSQPSNLESWVQIDSNELVSSWEVCSNQTDELNSTELITKTNTSTLVSTGTQTETSDGFTVPLPVGQVQAEHKNLSTQIEQPNSMAQAVPPNSPVDFSVPGPSIKTRVDDTASKQANSTAKSSRKRSHDDDLMHDDGQAREAMSTATGPFINNDNSGYSTNQFRDNNGWYESVITRPSIAYSMSSREWVTDLLNLIPPCDRPFAANILKHAEYNTCFGKLAVSMLIAQDNRLKACYEINQELTRIKALLDALLGDPRTL